MKKVRIILIEGNHLSRQGLSSSLQARDDIEIVGNASNAKEGLQLLTEQKLSLDVLMMGFNLPYTDGIDLIREIRSLQKEGEFQKLQILVLTEDTQPQTVISAFKAGADSYVLKNVQLEELVKAILTTSQGNSYIDPNIASIVLQSLKKSEILLSQSEDDRQEVLTSNKLMSSSSAIDNEENGHHCIDSDYLNLIESNPLTARELEVLELIVGGCNNAQIAERLFITVGTVKTHVRSILNKLCADDRTQAAVTALRTGLVE